MMIHDQDILTPRLVLARPRIGENIGFVVRLQANFLVDELCIIDPMEGWRRGAVRTAAMCLERLAEARILPDLGAALRDCTHVFGFTARSGSDRQVQDLHEHLFDALPRVADPQTAAGQKLAFVFGNEESGLSSAEVAHCTRLFTIPLPGLDSLNLSHAVAIVLAEWNRHRYETEPSTPGCHPLIDHQGRQLLAARIREGLASLDYAVDDPHFDGMLRRLVESAEIETRDARILHKILKHLDWLQSSDS